jgi:hypothetical protein
LLLFPAQAARHATCIPETVSNKVQADTNRQVPLRLYLGVLQNESSSVCVVSKMVI